jgi:hypothetical protein
MVNFVAKYNTIQHVSEGIHFYGTSYSNGRAANTCDGCDIEFNYFTQIHRMGIEFQVQTVNHAFINSNNVFSQPLNGYYESYVVSMPCCQYGHTFGSSTISPAAYFENNIEYSTNSPGFEWGVEAWGTGTQFNRNILQGTICTGFVPGFNSDNMSISNNVMQGPIMAGGACPNYPGNGSFIAGPEDGGTVPQIIVGNITGSTPAAITSVAPGISPVPGAYSFPLTVTLTDPGYTSGSQPLGNTSIWYTTDGSTPVPGTGTAQYLASGGTFVLASPATVKAVGMWGTPPQPLSYPSGYGFVPSLVPTATYTSGSATVTLSGVTVAAPGGSSTVQLGSSLQLAATCHYSDGSTTPCNTLDIRGNVVTAWNTTNGNVTVNSSGLATGVAIGTTNVTATVTGGMVSNPAFTVTVSASPLTLTSLTLATTGGVTSIMASTSNEIVSTCHYNDGSTTPCYTVDGHGNVAGNFLSSAPTVATIDVNSGLAVGVAAGSTNLTASVTPAPSMLGTNLENVTGFTNNGFINEIYGVTGTSAGSYTPGNCHITIPATSWTAGKHWACILVLGTPTTQNAAATCSNTYTTTGTSWPGGDIVISMAGCPALPPDQGYWLGSTTDQTTANPAQSFSNCNSACSGGVPIFGSGTYPYCYVANTYGSYTSLPTTFAGCSTNRQVSQYLLLTTTPVNSNTLPLNVTAAPPSLVSAYITGTSSLVVPNTAQMAAKCHYTSGPDQDCTVADIYGHAVSTWTSSDPTKATVGNVGSANPGLVTAVAAGTPSITARISGLITSTAYPITVTSPAVTLTGISLSTTSGVTGLFVSSTNQLHATCTYSDGSSDDCTTADAHGNLAHSYTSTTPAHATVNATTGLVTGVAAGSTTFTAVAGSFTSGALPLAVFPVLSGIYTITISGPVTFSGTVRF